MSLSPELIAKMSVWKQRSLAGTLTIEEQREAIALMRADRLRAGEAAKSSRRASPTPKSADQLFSELEGL